MIVALGIFSIVAVVALGALVKIISANQKAQTLQSSITNLNFALDAMSRELRVGTAYHCDENPSGYNYDGVTLAMQACPSTAAVSSNNSSAALVFKSSKTGPYNGSTCNLAYAYRFVPNGVNWSLQKATQSTCGTSISNTLDVPNGFSDIIDPNVTITGYYIKVQPDVFPRVTIRISGYAGFREKEKTFFDVQTTVAARTQ